MIEKLRELSPFADTVEETEEETGTSLPELRYLAAELLVTTGAGATLQHLFARPGAGPATARRLPVSTWAPLLIGPLAAAAQVTHARRPTPSTQLAVQVLNSAVVGLGLAGLLESLYRSGEEGTAPSPAPLAFGSAGLLGWLLDRRDRAWREERDALEKRARIVERFVPRRKARLDRVVVHV